MEGSRRWGNTLFAEGLTKMKGAWKKKKKLHEAHDLTVEGKIPLEETAEHRLG